MAEQPIFIYMPRPPSLNKLWITIPGKKRRVRSAEYATWITTAGWEVKRQVVGMPPMSCRYNMEIQVPISSRDTGNWEKAIGDLLQTVGVVTNDGNVHELRIVPMERNDCMIALTPLPEMGGIRAKAKAARLSGGLRPTKPPTAALLAVQRARDKGIRV